MSLKKLNYLYKSLIITFIILLLFLVISFYIPSIYKIIFILIGLFPFILFLITTFIINKKNQIQLSKKTKIALSVVLFWYYIMSILMNIILISFEPITDIKYYSTDNLTYFPTTISKSAEKVKYYKSNNILKKSSDIILYYQDKKLDIKTFDKKYSKLAKYIGKRSNYNGNIALMNKVFTNVNVKNQGSYKLYIINSKCNKTKWCKHGKLDFVALNEKTKSVIYKHSKW